MKEDAIPSRTGTHPVTIAHPSLSFLVLLRLFDLSCLPWQLVAMRKLRSP
jgi:hypothetical protein